MNDRVLINWGSYDVDNFGDLLFPFLIEHYLGNKYSKIIHTSPTGKASVWQDSVPTCTMLQALTNENITGIVIGGGNLISFTESRSVNYVENEEFSKIVHPSFFYLPYLVRIKYGIPYAYNYVGVAKPIAVENQDTVRRAIDAASYISCRDEVGAKRLTECKISSSITVGPDSAIDISKVFSGKYLEKHYHKNEVSEKYAIPRNRQLAVIHLKKRYLKNQFFELSRIISFLTRNNIHPVFIPLGMCHNDQLLFESPLFVSQQATIIRKPELLIDILAILSMSSYYIGSSLHGAIASLSYNKRIVIVADEKDSKFSKFSGFLSQVGLRECLYSTWEDAYFNMEKNGLPIFKTTSPATRNYLDNRQNNWDSIYLNLQQDKNQTLTAQRNDFWGERIAKHYHEAFYY